MATTKTVTRKPRGKPAVAAKPGRKKVAGSGFDSTEEREKAVRELVARTCLTMDAYDFDGYLDLCHPDFRYTITTYSPELRKDITWLDHDFVGMKTLLEVLPRADFVLVTVPETPETQGMFAREQFRAMKDSAFFINIGRGATTVLDDLVDALRAGEIAGAGLDVFQVEPLPAGHPLWTTPGVLITPHVAGVGPYLDDRRTELFVDNCKRFNEGRPLRNVVDKANWF